MNIYPKCTYIVHLYPVRPSWKPKKRRAPAVTWISKQPCNICSRQKTKKHKCCAHWPTRYCYLYHFVCFVSHTSLPLSHTHTHTQISILDVSGQIAAWGSDSDGSGWPPCHLCLRLAAIYLKRDTRSIIRHIWQDFLRNTKQSKYKNGNVLQYISQNTSHLQALTIASHLTTPLFITGTHFWGGAMTANFYTEMKS